MDMDNEMTMMTLFSFRLGISFIVQLFMSLSTSMHSNRGHTTLVTIASIKPSWSLAPP